ncbi:GYF domain-containing protein [Forsythia ovata]|uniref:GYF domain-containing protein n=1 Tax=Forsythia ovata TaxID=205694 RepID=A0ABD1U7U7_9LAMI
MADKTVMDSRPNQISKDLQGSDNSIPLSPQWLLPKPGENKTGVLTGENLLSQLPVYANHSNTMKSPGEDLRDDHKKKDVFRPSVLDMESSRRDRWRDEERDTNSSVRKDRWREGDKDVSDNRKDRWTDSSGRHYGEARRAPVERWNDSGNRENSHDQRRESKWNTRWGPDEKETDHVGEKWVDSGKDADMLLDKGPSHPAYHGKDDREGDNHRPWRSNSAYSRGRVEPPHHQTSIPNKQVPTFVHGRGRGENPAPTFSLGRGRVGSGGSSVDNTSIPLQPLGFLSERDESGQGEPYLLRYSRTKLLDVYRTTEMKSRGKFLDGIVQVPSLTKEEPVEPLAFCAPTPEELVYAIIYYFGK